MNVAQCNYNLVWTLPLFFLEKCKTMGSMGAFRLRMGNTRGAPGSSPNPIVGQIMGFLMCILILMTTGQNICVVVLSDRGCPKIVHIHAL